MLLKSITNQEDSTFKVGIAYCLNTFEFDELTKVIFNKIQCEIFYFENLEDYDQKQYYDLLSQMDVVIVPIYYEEYLEFDFKLLKQLNINLIVAIYEEAFVEAYKKIQSDQPYVLRNYNTESKRLFEESIVGMIAIYQHDYILQMHRQEALCDLFVDIAKGYDDCYILKDAQINYENAIKCLEASEYELYYTIRKKLEVYEALIDLCSRQANYEEAMQLCLICETLYEEELEYNTNEEVLYENNKKLCYVIEKIADLYGKQELYEKAIEYYDKLLVKVELLFKLKSNDDLKDCKRRNYFKQGEMYRENKQASKALECYDIALEMIFESSSQNQKDLEFIIHTYYRKFMIYYQNNQYELAIDYGKQIVMSIECLVQESYALKMMKQQVIYFVNEMNES